MVCSDFWVEGDEQTESSACLLVTQRSRRARENNKKKMFVYSPVSAVTFKWNIYTVYRPKILSWPVDKCAIKSALGNPISSIQYSTIIIMCVFRCCCFFFFHFNRSLCSIHVCQWTAAAAAASDCSGILGMPMYEPMSCSALCGHRYSFSY